MVIKLKLVRRETSPPHLYIDQIKEIIKDDEELTQPMKHSLQLLKKFKMPYIILPQVMEVIISNEFSLNLERSMNPNLTSYSLTYWTQKEKIEFKEDKTSFLRKILTTYTKMGYDIGKETITLDEVKTILRSVEKDKEKLKEFEAMS